MATKLSMKLLYDKESKKVLFAEAEKNTVDFLFYILTLPLATVTSLLTDSNKAMVGCLSNLYKSVESLDNTYIVGGQTKDSLLKPMISISQEHLLLSDINVPITKEVKLYRCPNQCNNNNAYFTNNPTLTCRSCKYAIMNVLEENWAARAPINSKGDGFVKDMATFMIMDNLEIKPMSTISTISSLCVMNQFNIKDVKNLQEKVVDFGLEEGMKILEASLKGKRVLTTVFL